MALPSSILGCGPPSGLAAADRWPPATGKPQSYPDPTIDAGGGPLAGEPAATATAR